MTNNRKVEFNYDAPIENMRVFQITRKKCFCCYLDCWIVLYDNSQKRSQFQEESECVRCFKNKWAVPEIDCPEYTAQFVVILFGLYFRQTREKENLIPTRQLKCTQFSGLEEKQVFLLPEAENCCALLKQNILRNVGAIQWCQYFWVWLKFF
jgi:hypothetical protein